MREPTSGSLVSFDHALFVTPPSEYAVGYVPIVVRQEKSNVDHVNTTENKGFPHF